jgi:hypothetical protein
MEQSSLFQTNTFSQNKGFPIDLVKVKLCCLLLFLFRAFLCEREEFLGENRNTFEIVNLV